MNDTLILIVDDEPAIRRLLVIALQTEGYKTIEAATGEEALAMTASYNPAMVLLDLGLPGIDGKEVLNRLREWYARPIMILSVRNSEEDIVVALDSGANDYLTKPFRVRELQARIRLSLRKHGETDSDPVIDVGNLSIDLANRIVRKSGEILRFTSTEFAMLSLFARNRGRVLTHQYIIREVWGDLVYADQSQNLRVFIASLRKKIEPDPSEPTLLLTESRIGYRFGL